MFSKRLAAVVLMAAVFASACSSTSINGPGSGGGGNALTPVSRIVTLNEDGSIPDQNFANTGSRGNFSSLTNRNGRLSGFAYQYGQVTGTNQFLGVAGVAPTSDPGSAPTSATATYTGDYALTYVNRGVAQDRRGEITLDADFGAGELEGSADGLVIAGTISGQDVGGTATFRGVEAAMDGVIGSERAITAFAGRTNNELLVGGIDAEIDPED